MTAPGLPTVLLRRPRLTQPLQPSPLVRLDPVPGGPVRLARRVLRGYLAGTFVLLALVLLLAPAPQPSEQAGRAPAHRVEVVQVDGSGLNTLVRLGLRGAAWSTAHAIDRQHALLAPSPLTSRVLAPLASQWSVWREAQARPLMLLVIAAVGMLALHGMLTQPTHRGWLLVIALLVTWSMAACYPRHLLHVAELPGQATSRLAVALVGPTVGPTVGTTVGTTVDPDQPGGDAPAAAQRQLGDRWWRAYVTDPLSRAQTGSTILTQVPPEQRAGLFASLRQHVRAVRERALGRDSGERALIGLLSLASALVFAALVTVWSMAAWTAQSLLLLLVLAMVLLFPLLVGRRQVWRLLPWFWLAPALGALGLTALGTLGSVLAAQVAVWLANAGDGLLRLAGGPIFALAVVLLAVCWPLRRARRARQAARRTGDTPPSQPGTADAA
jgi:hypothetical protein